jgi:hypothetical protein
MVGNRVCFHERPKTIYRNADVIARFELRPRTIPGSESCERLVITAPQTTTERRILSDTSLYHPPYERRVLT